MPAALNHHNLRATLGRYATGVAIVIGKTGAGALAGMTINSFTSVSLDPPLVLWAMQKNARSASAFLDSPDFTISVLSAEQADVAQAFTKSDAIDQMAPTLDRTRKGLPFVSGAAWFDCHLEKTCDAGDHVIFIGHIDQFHTCNIEQTLLFHDGTFKKSPT